MYKLSITAALCMGLSFAHAQQHTCCSATDQFAAFGKDVAFVQKHVEPIPFNFVADKGKMQTYTCSDSTTAQAYTIEAQIVTNAYVLVFHEWWGLNDYIRATSEQIYADLGGNAHVIALDLYDGQVAATRDSAMKYMSALQPERAAMIIQSVVSTFGDNAEIATIGWCMGGGYSLQAGIQLQEQTVGCVMYYGFPEQNIERLKKLQANVLMIWANQDKWIDTTVVGQFIDDMSSLNKQLIVVAYNADHAFANPSNPNHNADMAADAYARSLAFIKEKLYLK